MFQCTIYSTVQYWRVVRDASFKKCPKDNREIIKVCTWRFRNISITFSVPHCSNHNQTMCSTCPWGKTCIQKAATLPQNIQFWNSPNDTKRDLTLPKIQNLNQTRFPSSACTLCSWRPAKCPKHWNRSLLKLQTTSCQRRIIVNFPEHVEFWD